MMRDGVDALGGWNGLRLGQTGNATQGIPN